MSDGSAARYGHDRKDGDQGSGGRHRSLKEASGPCMRSCESSLAASSQGWATSEPPNSRATIQGTLHPSQRSQPTRIVPHDVITVKTSEETTPNK